MCGLDGELRLAVSYEYSAQHAYILCRLTLHLLNPQAPALHQAQACDGSHPRSQPDLHSPDRAGKARSRTGVQVTPGVLLLAISDIETKQK